MRPIEFWKPDLAVMAHNSCNRCGRKPSLLGGDDKLPHEHVGRRSIAICKSMCPPPTAILPHKGGGLLEPDNVYPDENRYKAVFIDFDETSRVLMRPLLVGR